MHIAPQTAVVGVVREAVGHFTHPEGWVQPKTRIWILENQTVIIHIPGPGGAVVTSIEELSQVNEIGTGLGTLVLTFQDGRQATLIVKPCACGFGAVASAGPVEVWGTPYQIRNVRPVPNWYIPR